MSVSLFFFGPQCVKGHLLNRFTKGQPAGWMW